MNLYKPDVLYFLHLKTLNHCTIYTCFTAQLSYYVHKMSGLYLSHILFFTPVFIGSITTKLGSLKLDSTSININQKLCLNYQFPGSNYCKIHVCFEGISYEFPVEISRNYLKKKFSFYCTCQHSITVKFMYVNLEDTYIRNCIVTISSPVPILVKFMPVLKQSAMISLQNLQELISITCIIFTPPPKVLSR